INKSRHLGADNQPKTQKSRRVIRIPRFLIDTLLTLPSFAIGADRVFLNKYGDPLDAGEWAKDSGHSLRYVGGMSSHTRLDNRFRGHFEHERQKCQTSSPGGERYSMNAPPGKAQTLCSAANRLQVKILYESQDTHHH